METCRRSALRTRLCLQQSKERSSDRVLSDAIIEAQLLGDALTQRCETPSVGLPPGVPNTRIRQQADALQAREQLGDLALVVKIGVLTDTTIAGPRMLGRGAQHQRGPVRQAHRDLPQRVLLEDGPRSV